MLFRSAGGAILLEERDNLPGRLTPILEKLVGRDPVFEEMRRKLAPLAKPEAAKAILEDLGRLVA